MMMAALLVSMSVMAIVATALMPAWRTMAQREKEEELIFRGRQYARAVALYQRKFGNAFPPSIDALVAGRFLRKKYKDPITGDEFLPLTGAAAAAAQGGPRGPAPAQGSGGAGAGQQLGQAPSGVGAGGQGPAGAAAGLIGVVSKSTDSSLRIYEGRTHYNEWAFVAQVVTNQPGASPGAQQPGGSRAGAPGSPRPSPRPGSLPSMPGPQTGPMLPGPRRP